MRRIIIGFFVLSILFICFIIVCFFLDCDFSKFMIKEVYFKLFGEFVDYIVVYCNKLERVKV